MKNKLIFRPLASGSKGNSLYLETPEVKLLIDAGLSPKQLEARLNEIGVSLSEIQAILVTHDHSDHIGGLGSISSKYQIPVFTNGETAKAIVSALDMVPRFKIFTTGEPFAFGDLEILPFTIPHDTVDPVAFTIRQGDLKLGIAADLGFGTSLVKRVLKDCHYLYLEANHEESFVHASSRPRVYKDRVLSKLGHLSNKASADILSEVAHSGLVAVHLAHLSSECNSEAKALEVVNGVLEKRGIKLNVSVAYQDKVSHEIAF